MQDTAQSGSTIFFSKQPILDAEKRIWGYELLGGEVKEGMFEALAVTEGAAASMSSSTLFGLQDAMERGKKVLVAFDNKSIASGLPRALPAEYGSIRLPEESTQSSPVMEALGKLRSEGYQVILDLHDDSPHPIRR